MESVIPDLYIRTLQRCSGTFEILRNTFMDSPKLRPVPDIRAFESFFHDLHRGIQFYIIPRNEMVIGASIHASWLSERFGNFGSEGHYDIQVPIQILDNWGTTAFDCLLSIEP